MILLLLIALIGISAGSVFLSVRGLRRLYLIGQTKMILCVLAVFILVPLLLLAAYFLLPAACLNIWTVVPQLLLAIVWLLLGYAVQIYLQREKSRRFNGIKRNVPVALNHERRNALILIFCAVLIWLIGAFVGFRFPVIETCAICACVFMLAKGLYLLWHYRGF